MKKIFYSFILLNLLFVSCSDNDDTPSTPENLVLPKTIKTTYPDFPQENGTSVISYDGNKIISIARTTSITKFIYSGNVITKKEFYKIDAKGIETIIGRTVYEYEKGKLKSQIATSNIDNSHPNGEYINKYIFNYRTDGTVSYEDFNVNPQTSTETKQAEYILTYKSGNLIKLEIINVDTQINPTVFTYEYDNKNTPFKNVLGFDLIDTYTINNLVKITGEGGSNTSQPTSSNLTCIYNTEGYPTKYSSFSAKENTLEYEIEYTY